MPRRAAAQIRPVEPDPVHRSRLVQRAQIAQVESKPSGDYVVRLTDGRELAGSRRFRRPLLEP